MNAVPRRVCSVAPTGLIVVLISLGALFMLPGRTYACTCTADRILPLDKERERVAVIFAGTVSATRDGAPGMRIVTFNVSTVWKGSVTTEIKLTTPAYGPSCGVYFDIGESWLVYAYTYEGALQVDSCTRTNLLDRALSDVQALGSGQTTLQPTAAQIAIAEATLQPEGAEQIASPYSDVLWGTILIGIVGLGAAALAILFIRRRPAK